MMGSYNTVIVTQGPLFMLRDTDVGVLASR